MGHLFSDLFSEPAQNNFECVSCAEVTLCGWQAIKIQVLINLPVLFMKSDSGLTPSVFLPVQAVLVAWSW